MRSIGIWYKLNTEEIPQLDFHINLWNLKGDNKRIRPFVDFGISISDFRKIKSIDILLPFIVENNQMVDLYELVKTPEIVRLISKRLNVKSHLRIAIQLLNQIILLDQNYL